MSDYGFKPKGRASLPKELLQFGTHLVYSEGTKTEPYYVDNIKKNIAIRYNKRPNDIEIVSATKEKSYHTIDLVKYAIDDVEKRLKEGHSIDHVWVFFDKDDFDDFAQAHALIMAQNNSNSVNADGFKFNNDTGVAWHSCWSNQCFELWLCLYFNYYDVPNDRKLYKQNLEKSTPLKGIHFEYEKNLTNIHDIIIQNGGSLSRAIKFAKMLESENNIGDPSTGVYLFAEYFEKYLSD